MTDPPSNTMGMRRMSRKPQRGKPKQAIQVSIDAADRRKLVILLGSPEHQLGSFSQLFECLLFLLEGIYIENSEARFTQRLYEVAAQRASDIAARGAEPVQELIHLTIDASARAFMDLLKQKYRNLLGSRSKVATLVAYWASRLCADRRGMRYLARRLEQVRRAHAVLR